MAFIEAGSSFPPENWAYWFRKWREWEAWYSGDPQQLLELYSSIDLYPDTETGRFWARLEKEERQTGVHIPAAGDIAATSSNLLFAEMPKIEYDEAAKNSGDRISMFIKENGLLQKLLEAAELAAALSGVFLKLDIEPDLVKIPILTCILPSQAFPTFWRDRLSEVLFYRVVKETQGGERVWRLFENRSRDNGYLLIEYRLYRGTKVKIGREVDMESIEETKYLKLEDIRYKMEGLGCVYVPNMRPNRLDPNSPMGINDFDSVISLMDSLDFTWSSLIRDIEMGLAQVLIDQEILDINSKFNKFQKAFVKLKLAPWRLGGESIKPIEQVQFDIRVEQHLKACESLFTQIVTQSGYSAQTFGLNIDGKAESGTALRIRERKSLLTREKKGRYWQPALASLFMQMQQMDIQSNLSTSYKPQEVTITLEDSIIIDPKDVSETIRNLEQAKTVSTYSKVKRLNPEWEETAIEEEVDKILKEQGINDLPFENTNKTEVTDE